MLLRSSRILSVGETESTWYVGYYLVYCTSPGWYVEQLVEWELAGETEVLGGNLSYASPSQIPHDLNPGSRGGKPATIHLNYGTA
jgi:hypothetical protein